MMIMGFLSDWFMMKNSDDLTEITIGKYNGCHKSPDVECSADPAADDLDPHTGLILQETLGSRIRSSSR